MHGTLGHNPCPVLNSLTPVNAALVRLLLFEMCGEAGVQMLLGCTFVAGKVYGHRLRRVYVQGRAKRFEVEAQVFIDATGDGDLCESIGIPFEKGGPDGELQPASLIDRFVEYFYRWRAVHQRAPQRALCLITNKQHRIFAVPQIML